MFNRDHVGRHFNLILTLTLSIHLLACTNVKLEKINDVNSLNANYKGEFCVSGTFRRFNKIIFIVDKSGSNVLTWTDPNDPTKTVPASDPNGTIRRNGITQFYDQMKDQKNTTFGLISFQGISSKIWTVDPVTQEPILSTGPEFINSVNNLFTAPDEKKTPYIPALLDAQRLIESDIKKFPDQESEYNIFFVTDGMPSDVNNTEAPPSDIHYRTVETLRKLAPGKIRLHVLLYGTDSTAWWNFTPAEINSIKLFSESGGGYFLETNLGNNIDFMKLLKSGGDNLKESWLLKNNRLVIYNLNSANCDDGTVDVDSDSDGLCDKDEIRYNDLYREKLAKIEFAGKIFDPLNRNSFNVNYSDFFVFKSQVLNSQTGLAPCAGSTKAEFDLLNSCEKQMLFAETPWALTDDWKTWLEINGRHASPNTPDSEGDGFIDFISFVTFRTYSAPVNFNMQNENFQGATGLQLLNEHRNPIQPHARPELFYQTELEALGYNEFNESCFRLKKMNLPVYPTIGVDSSRTSGMNELAHMSGENRILIYYIATPERDPNGRHFTYRYNYQSIDFNSSPIDETYPIDFESFKLYKVKD